MLNDIPLTNKNMRNNKNTQEDLLGFNEKYKKKYLELNERSCNLNSKMNKL